MKVKVYRMTMVAILLIAMQISKGQTFELGFFETDSTMVDNVNSRSGPILIDVIKFFDIDTITSQDDNWKIDTTGMSGPTRGGYYINLHPHILNKFTIDTKKEVGEIPMQHQVQANGSTTYTVPIECAPGRAGVQPSISLVYNSLGGNSVLGYGWGIGGMSSIVRTALNYYYDGSAQPAEMTKYARFTLDGIRIIENDTPTTTVRKFVPEHGNMKIEAYMNGEVTKYFKVWFSNGSKAVYGDTVYTTTNKLQYPITRMTDVLGNTIKFSYDENNNHYYIKEIKYGSSKTINNDFASIKFTYKNRDDVSSVYEAGQEIKEEKLLENIQCINNNTTIRTYKFDYTLKRISLLTKIDCELSTGSLNPLQFFYGTSNNPPSNFTKSTSQLPSGLNITVDKLIFNKGKFDIQNNDDALIVYPDLKPYKENSTGYENEYTNNQQLLIYSGLRNNNATQKQLTADEGFILLTSGDFYGMGRDKLIKINNIVEETDDRIIFNTYEYSLTQGKYLPYTTYNNFMPAIGSSKKSVTPKAFLIGDFTGLGKSQVLVISQAYPLATNNLSKIRVFNPISDTYSNVTNAFNFKKDDIVFGMDYNGDGRTEICHIHANGTDIYAIYGSDPFTPTKIASISDLKRNITTASMKLIVGDINGDGKTDLLLSPIASYDYSYWTTVLVTNYRNCPYCGVENPGKICRICKKTLPNSTVCFECGSTLVGKNCPVHGPSVYTSITEYIDNGNQWTIYYSKGKGDTNGTNGFDKKTQSLINHEQNNDGKTAADYVLQDINGDGKDDLVRIYNGNIDIYAASGITGFSTVSEAKINTNNGGNKLIAAAVNKGVNYTKFLSLNYSSVDKITFSRNDTRERMISGAVNSFGVVNKSEYKELNNYSFPVIYESVNNSSVSFPNWYFDGSLFWATAETQTYYDNLQKACNSYFYSTAIIHRQGLGFRGFIAFKVTDKQGKSVTQTFDPVNFSVLKKVETPDVSRIENTYTFSTASNKIATVRLTKQVVTDLLNNNAVTTDYSSFDAYNQPKKVETVFGTNSNIKTKREYLFDNLDSGSGNSRVYVIGLTTEEKITKTRDNYNTSWIDKTTITYNTKRLPEEKNTYTGISGTKQTGYEKFVYDTEGNLTTHTFKPYSSTKTQTTSYKYDTKKRWLFTKTDPMNLSTKYRYDSFGRLTSVTNYLNQKDSSNYDVMDRVVKTISADGVTNQTAYAWNTTTNGSVLSVTSTATKRPTTVKYVDAFGRITRESVMGFKSNNTHTDYFYDDRGRLWKKSDPFFTSASQYTVYTYDGNDRITNIKLPSTREKTITYTEKKVAILDAEMSTYKTYDTDGVLKEAYDPAGTIKYTYRHDGQLSKITTPDNKETKFDYDDWGRQKEIVDPSAGTIKYEYNSEGLLYKKTNARNLTTEYQYNDTMQIKKIIPPTPEPIIEYKYDVYRRLKKVTASTHYEIAYGYDALGRVNKETEKEGTITLMKDYTYTAGKLETVKYNSVAADMLTYNYDTYGYLSEIRWGTSTVYTKIYTVNECDHFGQLKKYTFGNNVETNRIYSNYGSPVTIKTNKINYSTYLVNLSYYFDDTKGLLSNRNDLIVGGGQEDFTYNNRRLKTYGKPSGTVFYSTMGNITSKPDAGTLEYNNSSFPYQITDQINFPSTLDTDLRTATYTSEERPATITKAGRTATFSYNHAGERTKMAVTGGGVTGYTRTYLGGNYEHESGPSATTERLYLGGTAYNAPAVAIKTNGGSWTLHYIHRDYLGSIMAISDANTTTTPVETRSYDAWGRLRYASGSTLVPYAHNAQPTLLLRRGYTGHEHLPEFGLINMNARLYDPVIGRFLSPDPYVQAPTFSQSFNRYSYCINNPLKYTDPSGELFSSIVTGVLGFVGAVGRTLYAWGYGFKDPVKAANLLQDAWKDYGKQMEHAWKMDVGMLKTDPNKSGGGRAWELISRFTWQGGQTALGHLIMTGANVGYQVNNVTHGYGMTAVDMGLDGSAFSLGNFTGGPKGYKADWKDHLFVHEYGHYRQSQQYGPLFMPVIGIPSLLSATMPDVYGALHENRWFEADASYKGMAYFDKHYGSKRKDYVAGSPDFFDRNNFITGLDPRYINPRTGLANTSTNPIGATWHWTDIIIYIPLLQFLLLNE